MMHVTGVLLGLLSHCPSVQADRGPQGPLAKLPSKPGPHVGQIEAMGDNTWLNLGRPEPDPKWGWAEGRAYTNKMAYAPDLVGAFLCGEGPHGAATERGGGRYFNDDVFFYDLMAHRWICVSPGSNMGGFTMKLDANGFEATEDGQNVPVAFAVHGYECNEYVPGLGKFMTLHTGSPYSRKLMEIRKAWLGDKGPSPGKHPFLYDVKTGRWERRKVEGEGPDTHFCHSLTWAASRKRVLYYRRSADFWLYDPEANHWSRLAGKGDPPKYLEGSKGGYEGTLCHDTKRDRLYVFNGGQVSIPAIYDIGTNTWSDPQAKNQPYPGKDYANGVRRLASTSSGVHYDSANDVAVMRLTVAQGEGDPRNIDGKRVGLAVYDPEKNAWEETRPFPEEMAKARKSWNSFYSPELNVHVYNLSRDGRTEDGEVWVYRYKKGGKRP